MALSGATETAWDLNAHVQTLTEVRCAQLRQVLAQGGAGLYLLMDPLLGDPVLPEVPPESMSLEALNALRAQAWQRNTHALCLPSKLSMDGAFAPYLVELQSAHDVWIETSVQWAVQETVHSWTAEPDQPTPHRVGGWLQSPAQGGALAAAMTGWLKLNAATAGQASYLRLADRRVLSLAVHVLGEACVAQALRPLEQWLWLDPQAALLSVSAAAPLADAEADISGDHTASQPLTRFSHAQWAQMALGPQVHRAMAQAIGQAAALGQPQGLARWQPVSATQWQTALAQAERQHKEVKEGMHP